MQTQTRFNPDAPDMNTLGSFREHQVMQQPQSLDMAYYNGGYAPNPFAGGYTNYGGQLPADNVRRNAVVTQPQAVQPNMYGQQMQSPFAPQQQQLLPMQQPLQLLPVGAQQPVVPTAFGPCTPPMQQPIQYGNMSGYPAPIQPMNSRDSMWDNTLNMTTPLPPQINWNQPVQSPMSMIPPAQYPTAGNTGPAMQTTWFEVAQQNFNGLK
jgi:hypothetical protein